MNRGEFEIFFKENYSRLCRFVTLMGINKEIAEDIVQEQFVYLWENQHRLNIQSYEAYVFQSTRNKAITHLRSPRTKKTIALTELNNNIEETDNAEQLLIKSELQQYVARAIELLPEKCGTIFYLKRFEDLSYKEISQLLSISEKTVENQMSIAIKKIAAYLKKVW